MDNVVGLAPVVTDGPERYTTALHDFLTNHGRQHGRPCVVCHGGQNRPLPGTVTYIVARGDYYKIGRTADLKGRLRALARGGQVRVPPDLDESQPLSLGLIYTGDVEHALHWEHRGAHVIGEWFSREKLAAWAARQADR